MKKIIVTLGPSTRSEEIVGKLNARPVDYIRLNLSHTEIDNIKPELEFYKKHSNIPLVIDTEGSQVRTGNLGYNNLRLKIGSKIRLFENEIFCNERELYIRPPEAVKQLNVGDLVYIDFDAAILRVDDIRTLDEDNYVTCTVINGGIIGSNKAITLPEQKLRLPALSAKDVIAINIAKKMGINIINLSFTDNAKDVLAARSLNPNAFIIAKIETLQALINLDEILEETDAILIDRGDLSREIAIEKISFAQKEIISKAQKANVPVFVATNFLDTMIKSRNPSRAEINDIVNTLLDGADGLVLAAETAVGNHPIECVNLLQSIFSEFESMLEFKNKGNYLNSIKNSLNSLGNTLIEPHGKTLIQSTANAQEILDLNNLKSLNISYEQAIDAELIAIGSYSPIEGFMDEADFWSVLENFRLDNGTLWPLPICLQSPINPASKFLIGETIKLIEPESKRIVALLTINSIYTPAMDQAASLLFETSSDQHPGVKKFKASGSFFIGGKISLIEKNRHPHKKYELTPLQTRKIFESRGWSRIVGFHSRNPIHRSHEFIQMQAMKIANADGLFIHPVIGIKKVGDFTADSIVKSYEIMLSDFYDVEKVLFATFPTYSRYAGPREALFTALCRQNYGCTHFIIGRDHTGVGDFYEKDASQKIFERFSDIKIEPICFDDAVYKPATRIYSFENECRSEVFKKLSGTKIRSMLSEGIQPPSWLMRPEISNALLERRARGADLFVCESQVNKKLGQVLWFSGYSGSGKSTLARALKEKLQAEGHSVHILDGDEIRAIQTKNLGFSQEDITRNNQFIANLAKEYMRSYDFVLVPVISPIEKVRQEIKAEIGNNLKFIFVDTSLSECMRRDPKGLYQKVTQGLIKNFIGICSSNPYEKPENPDIVVKTEEHDIESAIDFLCSYINRDSYSEGSQYNSSELNAKSSNLKYSNPISNRQLAK